MVRVGIEPGCGAGTRARTALACRPVPRRRRSASRLVPVFPALRGRDQGQAPYRSCATAGWTLDPQGRASRKSLGNAVDPVDDRRQAGRGDHSPVGGVGRFPRRRDGLRRADAAHLRQLSQDPQHVPLHPRQSGRLRSGDATQWRLPRCIRSISTSCCVPPRSTKDVREHYDAFIFHRLYQRLKDFCIVDLSAIYFDVLKDRLYTSAPKSVARRSAQTALWRLGEALVRLLAPVMSFTSDEVWGYSAGGRGRSESVHLSSSLLPRT